MNMPKKYEFTGDVHPDNPELKRIRALIDIPRYSVKVGDLGGWLESEDNLSHNDDCWVGGEACVFDDAQVKLAAIVTDQAIVCDNAVISGRARVIDSASIWEYAKIFDYACVRNFAGVSGHAKVHRGALIADSAKIFDNAVIADRAIISGQAVVRGNVLIADAVKIRGYAELTGNFALRGFYIVHERKTYRSLIDFLPPSAHTSTEVLTEDTALASALLHDYSAHA